MRDVIAQDVFEDLAERALELHTQLKIVDQERTRKRNQVRKIKGTPAFEHVEDAIAHQNVQQWYRDIVEEIKDISDDMREAGVVPNVYIRFGDHALRLINDRPYLKIIDWDNPS